MEKSAGAWTVTGRDILPGLSIPLGFARGEPFDPREGLGARFRFVSVSGGAGVFTRDGVSTPFRAPAFFCLDEREAVDLEGVDPGSTVLAYFHPSILRSDLDFANVRPPLRDTLAPDALRDAYWLEPFTRRDRTADGIVIPSLALARRVAGLLDRMLEEAREQSTGWWPCRTRSYLIETLFAIVNERDASSGDSCLPVYPADELVRRFFVQVGTRYAEKLSLEGLARDIGTNRTTLQERVLAATGKSAFECVSAVRLDAARALLADTYLPVAEVAARTGYADTSSFARAFRKRFGHSPSDYRSAFGGASTAS